MTIERPPTPQSTSILSNPRSDRVKALAALSGRSARRKTSQYLIEGPQCVREAVAFIAHDIASVLVTQAAAQRYPEILESAAAHSLAVRFATDEVIGKISQDAQGMIAVARMRPVDLQTLSQLKPHTVAVLANVRDPGNAGTVIRAADALGADAVILSGESVDIYNPKLIRSTAGSLFHVPVITGPTTRDTGDVIAALRNVGLAVCAADGRGEQDVDQLADVAGAGIPGTIDLAQPTAWLFGNEAWGLREYDRQQADAVVRIPLRGHAESLNLAMAATICLYASARARRTREN